MYQNKSHIAVNSKRQSKSSPINLIKQNELFLVDCEEVRDVIVMFIDNNQLVSYTYRNQTIEHLQTRAEVMKRDIKTLRLLESKLYFRFEKALNIPENIYVVERCENSLSCKPVSNMFDTKSTLGLR